MITKEQNRKIKELVFEFHVATRKHDAHPGHDSFEEREKAWSDIVDYLNQITEQF